MLDKAKRQRRELQWRQSRRRERQRRQAAAVAGKRLFLLSTCVPANTGMPRNNNSAGYKQLAGLAA